MPPRKNKKKQCHTRRGRRRKRKRDRRPPSRLHVGARRVRAALVSGATSWERSLSGTGFGRAPVNSGHTIYTTGACHVQCTFAIHTGRSPAALSVRRRYVFNPFPRFCAFSKYIPCPIRIETIYDRHTPRPEIASPPPLLTLS